MKKIVWVILIVAIVTLASCAPKSALQEATGANSKQEAAIVDTLESLDIKYYIVAEANHNKPMISIPENLKVYNVLDSEAMNHFLVLDDELAVVAVLDGDSNIIYGSVQ